MNFTRQEVADQCHAFGESVNPLPGGIDGAQLLWAMAGVESTFGEDCGPRHESSYDQGGMYAKAVAQSSLLDQFGRAGACSYGPLQIMLVDAASTNEKGAVPEDFEDCFRAFALSVKFLDHQLARFKPQTLAEIGSIWNAGHIQHPLNPGVERYVQELQKYYAEPLPAASAVKGT